MEINTDTLFDAIKTELAFHKGQYIMTPTGIGCGFSEFKSVYSYENDYAENIQVDRQDNLSYILVDRSLFKVF